MGVVGRGGRVTYLAAAVLVVFLLFLSTLSHKTKAKTFRVSAFCWQTLNKISGRRRRLRRARNRRWLNNSQITAEWSFTAIMRSRGVEKKGVFFLFRMKSWRRLSRGVRAAPTAAPFLFIQLSVINFARRRARNWAEKKRAAQNLHRSEISPSSGRGKLKNNINCIQARRSNSSHALSLARQWVLYIFSFNESTL